MTSRLGARGMSVAELLVELRPFGPSFDGDPQIRLTAVHQDSRRAESGALFVARTGQREDGMRFVQPAMRAGAVAVLAANTAPSVPNVPMIRVTKIEHAAAVAAEAVYGWPSRSLKVIGITGTNGKTTVAYLVQQMLSALGARCGRLGTLGSDFEGMTHDAGLTTPQSDELSRTLARMRASGASHVAMEVSSVALTQGRVEALRFTAAALTNLTRDHLDDHGSMAAYAAAKGRLFREFAPAAALLNVDCELGATLHAERGSSSWALSRKAEAEVDYSGLEATGAGVQGVLQLPDGRCSVDSQLLGAHNAQNLAVTLGLCSLLGYSPASLEPHIPALRAAPGRLEACHAPGAPVGVVVDYAHTPDALVSALGALRPMVSGRLLCVFGCGGDRDPGKRQPMARAVARGADYAIVTNDNPRSEDPEAIAAEIERGFAGAGAFERILDRKAAIERAVSMAQPGDWVLVAGKGHETYQEICGQRHSFDDRVVARAALTQPQGTN